MYYRILNPLRKYLTTGLFFLTSISLAFLIRCNEIFSPFQNVRISRTSNATSIMEVLARRHATSTNTRSAASSGASAAVARRRASARRWAAVPANQPQVPPGNICPLLVQGDQVHVLHSPYVYVMLPCLRPPRLSLNCLSILD